MMQWQLVLCNAQSGEDVAPLMEATNVALTVGLYEPSSVTFDMPAVALETSLVQALAVDVKLYLDEVLVFRGRVMNPRRTFGGDAGVLSVSAYSYKELLKRRYLEPTDSAVTTGYGAGNDAAYIAAQLINTFQAKTNASFGIVTTSYVPSGLTNTGLRRFTAGTSIYDAINACASANTSSTSGETLEWDINPVGNQLVFEMYSNVNGSARGRPEAVFTASFGAGGSVVSGTETLDTSRFANYVQVYGTPVNEVQTVSATGATSGGFRLTFGGVNTTSGALLYNATASAVEYELNKLTSIAGNVSVSGGPLNTTPIVVTFSGDLGNKDNGSITVTSSTVAGASVTVSETQKGRVFTAAVGHTGTIFDYASSSVGRWDSAVSDGALLDTASVTERANYLAATFSQFIPSYSLTIEPSYYNGPTNLWIGDYVILDLLDAGWEVKRSDLRCTSMSFNLSAEGIVTLTIQVDKPLPADMSLMNLSRRVAVAENLWRAFTREIERLQTLADADNNITAKERANIDAAVKQREALRQSLPGYSFSG